MIETCVFADEVSKDFDEAVRLSVEAGATAIELRGGIWGKRVQEADDDDIARMRAVLEEYGARIGVIGSPVGKCSHEDPAEYEQHVRFFENVVKVAHAFDVDVVRGFAFWNPLRKERQRPNLDEYLPLIVEKFTPIVRRAEEEGLIYALETEGSTMTGTLAETRRIIDALGGGPALASCWDVNNGYRGGEEPLPDGYAQVRGIVRHVHVKPNADKNMDTVADSATTYEEVLNTLIADGYTGCAGIEHWGTPELMLEGVRQLRALLGRIQ
ncbi:MAG: sugar phosphate isomerase/epimerase family protein [Armatimonadota bacterium]|jgi:sugar phosphate isomerase/epimerase